MKRRDFLIASATGLSLAAIGRPEASGAETGGASGKTLRVGLIGCGWYGKCDLFRLIQVAPVEVVALCDVDSGMLAAAAELVATRQASKQKPRTFSDFREMLKPKDLDIVIIGTPDHWHALVMIAAVEAGADVYVQKPISVDIKEGEAMVAAARRTQRVVQVGTQRRSTPHLVEAREQIIKGGKLGKVAMVETYCYYHMRARDTLEQAPDTQAPDNLDWERWSGPASLRPYNRIAHPRGWRAFNEYGNGIVGDMCVHMLDMVRWLLDLGWPRSVTSTGGILVDKASRANIPDTQSALFDFGDLQVVWQHRTWGATPDPKYPWGATLYGDRGTLKASVMGYDFTPEGKGEAVHRDVVYELEQYPEDKTEKDLEKHTAPANRAHMRDFLAAIDSRGRPIADIEQGHISTASCILANLAHQLGRPLAWDAAKGQVANDPEANRLLKRSYRQPWIHPTG